MDEGLVGVIYLAIAAVGATLGVWRLLHDGARTGRLSVHDGQLLRVPTPPPASRLRYVVNPWRSGLSAYGTRRITVSGVEVARQLGFRIRGLTKRVNDKLEGRLDVEGTKGSAAGRRLFARHAVKEALRTLCGAQVSFKRVDLYPGGDLAVEVGPGDVDDFIERLLRFAEAIDDAAPHIDHDDIDLGSASGASSSAAFSIEIRS